ncbi:MAG: HD-GYP domain-containing protein [Phycisphaerales bacterium]
MNDPDAPELLSMWMCSKPFRQELVDLASIWSGMSNLEPCQPRPGMWVYPFEEVHRRRRRGYYLAIGFGPEILDSDLLAPSCVGGSLQLAAVKHQLAANAKLQPHSAEQIGQVLQWMFADLWQGSKSEETIDGFTEQLGIAYETVTMLCDVASGMGAVADPGAFVSTVGEHVARTLQYNWVAIAQETPDGLRAQQFGNQPITEEQLAEVVDRVENGTPDEMAGTTSIFCVNDVHSALAPQIVAHQIERADVRHGIIIAGGKAGEDPQVSTYETKSFESLSGLLGAFLENVQLYEDQRRMFFGTIHAMSGSLDAKDRYTRGHSDRVAYLSAEIARAMGFTDAEVERIHISGILHDVGKIGVPEAVLCKPGRLTDEEFDAIKLHPQIGYDIIKDIPSLEDVLPGVLHHHERYDGRGYPHGLAGEDIPLMARIIGVADTFDAMSSNRAYRSKMSREVVLAEIRKCAGSQFDPQVAEAFLTLDLSEYDRMVENHASQDSLGEAA